MAAANPFVAITPAQRAARQISQVLSAQLQNQAAAYRRVAKILASTTGASSSDIVTALGTADAATMTTFLAVTKASLNKIATDGGGSAAITDSRSAATITMQS